MTVTTGIKPMGEILNDTKAIEKRMRSGKPVRPTSRLAIVLVLLMGMGCQKPSPAPEVIRSVRAVKVGDLQAIQGREFPGRSKAAHEVDLSFRVSGPLISLLVDVGSQVKQGDVIAVVDPADFRTALDSAEANLSMAQASLLAMERGAREEELAQLKAVLAHAEANYRQALADHQRNEKLLRSGVATQGDFDATLARRDQSAAEVTRAREDLNIGLKGARPEDLTAKRAEIKSLKAAMDNARNQLDYAELKAPFDGTVASKYVQQFQTVQAKDPIVRLLNVSKIEVTVQVPESLIALAPRVKQVKCRFDALPGREFDGRTTKIGSEASQTTRTYPVTVEVDQPQDVQILPGMAAVVCAAPPEEEADARDDLVIPLSALFPDASGQAGQQSYVWVVGSNSGLATRRAVTLGELTPVGIAVTDGLTLGDWVVTAGVHSLREGQKVRVAQEGGR